MKAFSLALCGVLGIAIFVYFYYSTPRVLERRLDSLLSSLSFGLIELGDKASAADDFTSHFAEEISFSGSGNEIITGNPSRADMREIYLTQLRTFARSCQADIKDKPIITITNTVKAEMDVTIVLSIVFGNSEPYEQVMPSRLTWEKTSGQWVIASVKLLKPISVDANL